MDQVVTWIFQYSPPIAVALILGSAAIFVLKTAVEKAVEASYERESKRLELRLARRSSFEGEILKDRFAKVMNLSQRLERIATNLNRRRHGEETPSGFMTDRDIPPLTEVYEDLEIHRLVLTEALYSALSAKANHAQELAKAVRERIPAESWDALTQKWRDLDDELRARVERQFAISGIRWEVA